MKVECNACKKVWAEDDWDKCYSVWKCRKDHIHLACTLECHRIFEKKCSKVADTLIKAEKKLNNDGHTSALRRLPPCEREKFKQLNEAQQAGLMICPEEVKASDRSVPHCAHILTRVAGFGKIDGLYQAPEQEEVAPPPPPRQAAEKPQGPAELVSDDMLVVLPKDDKDLEVEDLSLGKKKKGQKAKKDKRGTQLLLDFQMTPHAGETEGADGNYDESSKPFQPAPYAPQTAGINGASANAWAPVAQQKAPELQRNLTSGQAEDIKKLANMLQCSDEQARALLKDNKWNQQAAVEAYFARQAGAPASEEATQQAAPKWGPKIAANDSSSTTALTASSQQAASQSQPEESGSSEPASPPVPEGWKALWAEEQNAFYYWEVATNRTQWDPPAMPKPAESSEALQAQQAQQARAEAQARAAEQAQARLERAAAEKAEREAAEAAARAEAERRAKEAAAERERLAAERQAAERQAAERAEAERVAAERRAEAERAAAAAKAAEEAARRLQEIGLRAEASAQRFVSSRHWRPKANIAGCIRLFHGDCVTVSWRDGQDEGWAFGRVVDEPSREGYFPWAILRELKREQRVRGLHERLSVCEGFNVPEMVGGYVSVQPGDVLRILHPMEDPYVWAYVERQDSQGNCEVGWVPEIVLGEPVAKDHAAGALFAEAHRGIAIAG